MTITMSARDKPCTLGIDLGTSSLKVVLLSAEERVLASAGCEYPTHVPAPGWAEQDPADWCAALKTALQLLRDEIGSWPELTAIGICAAAHIPVLLDAEDRVLRRAILWHDTRCTAQIRTLSEQQVNAIRLQAANTPSCCWTLPQLLWVAEVEPSVLPATRRFLTSKDYLNYRLTGIAACDDTSAASTMLYDYTARAWSPELVALSGLPTDSLPPIIPPLQILGAVLPEAAQEFGLPVGVPVIGGMLDSAGEMMSAKALTPGQGVVRLGTAGGIMLTVEHPVAAAGLITYPSPLGSGGGYRQAGTNCCALALRWLRDLLQDEQGPTLDWARLDTMASSVPDGAQGLLFHPYLQGERSPYWDASLRGSFIGESLHHGRAEHVRAVMEGVAFSLRDCLESFGERTLRELALVGGGGRSRVWPQIVADVLNLPLRICQPGDSTHGVALAAGLASGTMALGNGTPASLRVLPNAERAARYQQQFERYRAVQKALANIYQAAAV